MGAQVIRGKFQPSEDDEKATQALTVWAETSEQARDGCRVSFVEITQATGVTMDDHGKARLRRVLERSRRTYIAIPGSGIEFTSPQSMLSYGQRQFEGAAEAVQRAASRIGRGLDRHGEAMSQDEKNKLLRMQGVMASVQAAKALK